MSYGIKLNSQLICMCIYIYIWVCVFVCINIIRIISWSSELCNIFTQFGGKWNNFKNFRKFRSFICDRESDLWNEKMGLISTCKLRLRMVYFKINVYEVCPKSKCTDFLFKCLLDLPEITSYLLQSMTLGKLHSGYNAFSTDHSNTGSHFL